MKTVKSIYLWVKEFFIPCRLRRRYWEDTFIICGHRGSPHKEPENTLESFERAINDGANALEMDLCITKDEEIIIWHDWNPNDLASLLRENGFEPTVKFKPLFPEMFSLLRKSVDEFSFNEFRKYFSYLDKESGVQTSNRIPALQDFFIWSKNKDSLKYTFLDIKVPEDKYESAEILINKLKTLIEEYKPKFEIIIETNQKKLLKKLRKSFHEINFCLDIEPPGGFIFFPRLYSAVKGAIKNKNKYALAVKPRQITVGTWITHRRIINYDVRKRARFNKKHPDKKINSLIDCTINDPEEMECLIKSGIGGIQTDKPELLYQIAKKTGRIK